MSRAQRPAPALATLVGPAFIGRDIDDRARLMVEMAHRFHLHGRGGPVACALSAIEIALWDIAGKVDNRPLAALLGGAPCELTAYASLLRYAEPALVAQAVDRALSQGFEHIKLRTASTSGRAFSLRCTSPRRSRRCCVRAVLRRLASQPHDAVRAKAGRLAVPAGPGLGLEPDLEVIERYRVGRATTIGGG